jgi:hypothetical protein
MLSSSFGSRIFKELLCVARECSRLSDVSIDAGTNKMEDEYSDHIRLTIKCCIHSVNSPNTT